MQENKNFRIGQSHIKSCISASKRIKLSSINGLLNGKDTPEKSPKNSKQRTIYFVAIPEK